MIEMPTCEECGIELPEDTKKVTDPYDEDIHGEINKKYLCKKCYQLYCDEI